MKLVFKKLPGSIPGSSSNPTEKVTPVIQSSFGKTASLKKVYR